MTTFNKIKEISPAPQVKNPWTEYPLQFHEITVLVETQTSPQCAEAWLEELCNYTFRYQGGTGGYSGFITDPGAARFRAYRTPDGEVVTTEMAQYRNSHCDWRKDKP